MKSVKPRPLHIADPVPVFWNIGDPNGDDSQFLAALLDVPLEDATAVIQGPVSLIDHDGNALPRHGVGVHDHPSSSTQVPRNINIPSVRSVSDYGVNIAALQQSEALAKAQHEKGAYIRHVQPSSTAKDRQPEYCMDDEDEAWLNKYNEKFIKGRSTTEEACLSPEQFELLMDELEHVHFERLLEWYEDDEEPSTSSAIPKLPPLQNILSRRDASLVITSHDRRTVEAVYEHWRQRRRQEGGPLLPDLWFEQPWSLICYGPSVDPEKQHDRDAMLHDLPFSRRDKGVRSGARRRRLNTEAAKELLGDVRTELERLRTLADRVRRREKVKKQLLLVWQQEVQLRFQQHEEYVAQGQQQPQQKQRGGKAGASKAQAAKLGKAAATSAEQHKRQHRQALEEQFEAAAGPSSSKRPLEQQQAIGPGRPAKKAKLQPPVAASPRTAVAMLAKQLKLAAGRYNKTRAQKAAASTPAAAPAAARPLSAPTPIPPSCPMEAAPAAQPVEAPAAAAAAPSKAPAAQSAKPAADPATWTSTLPVEGPAGPSKSAAARRSKQAAAASSKPKVVAAAQPRQPPPAAAVPSKPAAARNTKQGTTSNKPTAESAAKQQAAEPALAPSPSKQPAARHTKHAAAKRNASKSAQRRHGPNQQQPAPPTTPNRANRHTPAQSAATRLVQKAKVTVRSPRLLIETDIANVLPQLDGSRMTRAVARKPRPLSAGAAARLAAGCAPAAQVAAPGAATAGAAGGSAPGVVLKVMKHKKRKVMQGLRTSVRTAGARK